MSEASQMIEEEAHEDVNLIWGWIVDEDMGDEVRVTVIATDFQEGWQPNSAVPSSNQPTPTRPSPQPPRGGGAKPTGGLRGPGLFGAPTTRNRKVGNSIPPFFGKDRK